MDKKILIIILGIFLISFVSAIPLPHAFYGDVNYSSGEKVNTGEITAKINENIVGSSEIIDGKYDLIAESEYGGLIKFYFDNEIIGNYTFKEFAVTELNFIIKVEPDELENETNQSEPEEPKPTESKKSFSNINDWGGEFCYPNWKCSGWGSCYNGIKTRTCYDANHCDFSYNKPNEKLTCQEGVQEKSFTDDKSRGTPILPFILITGILILILGILWVEIGK